MNSETALRSTVVEHNDHPQTVHELPSNPNASFSTDLSKAAPQKSSPKRKWHKPAFNSINCGSEVTGYFYQG